MALSAKRENGNHAKLIPKKAQLALLIILVRSTEYSDGKANITLRGKAELFLSKRWVVPRSSMFEGNVVCYSLLLKEEQGSNHGISQTQRLAV